MDYNNWFVLQVLTNREHFVKNFITNNINIKTNLLLFSNELIFKRKGRFIKVNRSLFPGYLFINQNIQDIVNNIKDRLQNEYIRPVCFKRDKCSYCFSERSPCMVKPEEMRLLLENSDKSGLFKLSYGYKKNDNIIITRGPLMNLKGNIIAINERKKVAQVELFLFKRKMKTTLGIDLIKKAEKTLV